MILDAILAILHHVFAFALLACLTAEWVLLMSPPGEKILQRLSLFDAGYGIAALGSLAAGISRLIWGIKPASYYLGNPIFWAKIIAWGAVGGVSIIPTIRYLRWRKAASLPTEMELARVRMLVLIQLILFPAVPILAALMARSYGR